MEWFSCLINTTTYLLLHGVEEGGEGGEEGGDDGGLAVGEEEEEQLLELCMFGLRGVKVGEDTVTAGEGGRGHECAGEDVALLDLVHIEEDGERGTVEEDDDPRVLGHEWPRRHVCPIHCGLVLVPSVGEEGVLPFVVEVV